MSFDRSRSKWPYARPFNVLAGATISAEGQALVAADNGAGGVDAKPCTGAAGEKFLGFSRTDSIRVSTAVIVESLTVPVGGGVVSLQHSNIVASSEYVYDVTAAAALTPAVSPPGAGSYTLNTTNGTIEFNAAEAGDTVTVQYRYNLTVEESKLIYRNSLPNNIATDYLGVVGAMGGEGEMFTDQYNTAVSYTVLGPVYLGANGLLTSAAGGTQVGYCTQVPGSTDGMLGLHYTVS